jgi:myo-inositol-1(or 4)-monophosphatase
MPSDTASETTLNGADRILMTEVVRAAGEIALAHFRAAPKVWMKAGNSPVSEADLAIDAFLKDRLLAERPAYGWLSEETADNPLRLDRNRVFVVDPIDGTRAFLAGREEWVISAAVVDDGVPVAGVLFQPTTGIVTTASLRDGAYQGNQRLAASPLTDLGAARIAGPKRVLGHLTARHPQIRALPHVPSLALRIAHVADTHLDLALASGNAHDWDLAAADLILREAGGYLAGTDGKPLIYNRVDPRHPALVASGAALWPQALALLTALETDHRGDGP